MGVPAEEPVPILLVDDRPENLKALEGLLRRADYNLVLAQSGNEALGWVLRRDFAVILLDVAMPRMDGFQTATIIKEREQSKLIPIIFVTASVYDMEHVFQGYTVGAVDYLRKPVDPQALRAKVAVFVELYRQRKQIERQAVLLGEAEVREQRLLRQRAENALRESETLYELTFEEAPVGIGHANFEGRWINGNRRLADILGLDRGALAGRRVSDMAEGEESIALAERVEQTRIGGTPYAGEHRLATARGEPLWGEVTLSALRDAGGEIRRLIVVVEDISERKRNELDRTRLLGELQEGIRARDDFLSIAAHELKTPITPLRLQAGHLIRGLGRPAGNPIGPERLLRGLGAIDRSAQRLETLVERLLDESRLGAGNLTLALEEVDLGALVRDAAGRLDEEASLAGSSFHVRAEQRTLGRWDRLRVDQAVTNLLTNAIKYGGRGVIEVTVTSDDDTARLSVRDHGIGIPLEAQERIFERFERAAPVSHFGGFGLGLWIVRRVVEAHGGRVTVHSQPGQGSEFSVELPKRADDGDRPAEPRAQGDQAHP